MQESRRATRSSLTVPSDLMERFNADCKRAGIAKRDGEGRTVDVHSLRHTFGTMLSRAGVPPRVATKLMWHSDIKLTMKTCTGPRLFDLAGAVEALPSVARSVAAPVAMTPDSLGNARALPGTDGRNSAAS